MQQIRRVRQEYVRGCQRSLRLDSGPDGRYHRGQPGAAPPRSALPRREKKDEWERMPSRRDFLKGALAAGAALPWAACSGGSPQPAANSSPGGAPAALPPRSGGTLRVGLNSDLTTMDP